MCGGNDHAHRLEAPEPAPVAQARWFLVVECRHCGLCFTNPRPSADSLAALYPPRVPLTADSTEPARRPPRLGDPLGQVWSLLQHGRLLDFGQGLGSFQRRLYHAGREFAAVNLSTAATMFLRRSWRVPAWTGSLPHPELAGQSFDAITCVDVLEHVHQPLEVLRAARQLLVPGGTLIVAVPNLDSLASHWFGAGWPGLDLPRHLTHFTPRTLRLMLHQANFRLQRLSAIRHSAWLRTAARRAGPATPWGRLLRNHALASLAGWYTALVRRANGILAVAQR